jgi:23S rRNA (adenine2503-C2)-methyltransferase
MPIDDAHPLAEVLEAVGDHARATRCSPMWAYTLLAGHNDDDSAADALADAVLEFAARNGIRPRLSLIPWNPVDDAPFARASDEVLARFRAVLRARGVGTIVRYSGGGDVDAACGQLARSSGGRASRLADRGTASVGTPAADDVAGSAAGSTQGGAVA